MNELEQLQQENEALRLALQAQQEINHYKQFFLARIAHELRSPLSSLISLQQLILHDFCETPAEEKEFLTDANVAAQKLLAIIDDLVTVAKIDYGKINLDDEPIILTELFAELNHLLKLPAGNRNFQLHYSAPDSLPLINGDRQKILWILRNLIDRSLEMISPGSGVITLEASLVNNQDSQPSKILITLGLPCAADVWQFSEDQPKSADGVASNPLEKISHRVFLSPAITWQLAQTLMVKMGGTMAIVNPDVPMTHPPQSAVSLELPRL
jgi:signal transduction histidine kinase